MKTQLLFLAFFFGLQALAGDCINTDQIDQDMFCIEVFDPVCGCDGLTYQNDCYAFYYGGVTSWTAGECALTSEPCDDLGEIDFGDCEMAMGFAVVNGACEYLSGCGYLVEGIDYTPSFYDAIEDCEACLETDDCFNPDQIDQDMGCFEIYDPVCGCDNETYQNECYAFYYSGITSWTEGECTAVEPGDCPVLVPGLDFGMCAAEIGVALINNQCVSISGCGTVASNGLDYEAYFYDSFEACLSCADSIECINPDQIDSDAACPLIEDPVCGCDGVTYTNLCHAITYGGVTSWIDGECAIFSEPCDDLGEIDFGECEMAMGFTVLNGACEYLSGCGYVVDGIDYTPSFYDDLEECETCLETDDCIDPEQIDETMICFEIYEPVCGCDSVTYQNECYAFYYGGVTTWTEGECQNFSEPCDDLGDIDFGLCDMYLGVAVVNGECQDVSGCGYEVEGIDYNPSFYDTFEACEECLSFSEPCDDLGDVDFGLCALPLGIALVNGECQGVSGCGYEVNGTDYSPSFYDTLEECEECLNFSEPCDDLGDIDFGLCDMYLGVAVVNGECQDVSGCGYEVEGIDYTPSFYDTLEECEECLVQEECINPDQIDSTMVCITIYDPVCGCDDVTYDNDCYAFYYGGVTSWTEGECTTGLDEQSLDFVVQPRANFQLYVKSPVLIESLVIYDLTGKIVTQFRTLASGEHLLKLPAHSAGIYIYHAHSKNEVESGKLFVR